MAQNNPTIKQSQRTETQVSNKMQIQLEAKQAKFALNACIGRIKTCLVQSCLFILNTTLQQNYEIDGKVWLAKNITKPSGRIKNLEEY